MSAPIASLPMYDWPEIRGETETIWKAVARRFAALGVDTPRLLTSDAEGVDHWLDPDLLFSQTCGYPFARNLNGKVDLLGTPVYDVEGCEGPLYSSAVIVRSDDTALTFEDRQSRVFAFNSEDSLSGFRCLTPLIGNPQEFFEVSYRSGGHRRSAQMVAEADADIAAIDAVCWHLLRESEPETAGRLRVLTWTQKLPALPFITAASRPKEELAALRQALSSAIGDLQDNQPVLRLTGLEFLDESHYRPLQDL